MTEPTRWCPSPNLVPLKEDLLAQRVYRLASLMHKVLEEQVASQACTGGLLYPETWEWERRQTREHWGGSLLIPEPLPNLEMRGLQVLWESMEQRAINSPDSSSLN